MTKIAKKELVEIIVETVGCTKKDATAALEAMVEKAVKTLTHGGEVEVSGVGKLVVKTRKARDAKNPATGEKIRIPAKKVPAFKAAKALKEAVK